MKSARYKFKIRLYFMSLIFLIIFFLIFRMQPVVEEKIVYVNHSYNITNFQGIANCSNSNVQPKNIPVISNEKGYSDISTACSAIAYPNISYSKGLLSPRVYTGILEPKSFLISNFQPLKEKLLAYMEDNNVNGSVYVENLRNGVSIGINQLSGYFPASLNKLPVAVLIMQMVEDHRLEFGTKLPIYDTERTDSSGTLYSTPAAELTVRELLEAMLKESDNTAFSVLYTAVDKNELASLLDYYNIDINIDYPQRRLEFYNHTDLVTPKSLYNLFSGLYLSTTLAPPQDSEYLLSLLANTTFNIKPLAHIPENVTIAHKWGEYYTDDTQLFHDCGIMYIGQSRIFYCIMTKNKDNENAKEDIGNMVGYVYNYTINTRTNLDIYKNSH